MSDETPLGAARERVDAELSALRDQQQALGAFRRRVEEIEPARQQRGMQTTATTVTGGGSHDGCERVRRAFADTVADHAESEGMQAVREELGPEIALALSPSSTAGLAPQVREQVLAATEERRQQTSVTVTALEREREEVDAYAETRDAFVSWLADADETKLSALGFDALRERREHLAAFEAELDRRVQRRQEFLSRTTSDAGAVGISNRVLLRSVYVDFPRDYPVLSALVTLYDCCTDCKAAVRAHLIRRV